MSSIPKSVRKDIKSSKIAAKKMVKAMPQVSKDMPKKLETSMKEAHKRKMKK